MRSTYGQEEETWGKTWDEVRQILLDADTSGNSYLVEWSNDQLQSPDDGRVQALQTQ